MSLRNYYVSQSRGTVYTGSVRRKWQNIGLCDDGLFVNLKVKFI